MQITIKNYSKYIANHYEKYDNNDDIIKVYELGKQQSNISPNFQSLITSLNNNSILNPPFQHKLIIDFENFTLLNKIILNQKDYFKRKLNKWFKTEFTTTDDYAFYSKENKKIHIREQLFNEASRYWKKTFSECLKSQINQSDFLNFVILHDIGHALHHQYYLENKKQLSSGTKLAEFINESVPFNGYIDLVGNIPNKSNTFFRDKDLNLMNFHAVNEGFADLYSCIVIGQIYPQVEAINLINSVIESRKEADKGYEFYQTHVSLESYLNDLKNNEFNLNNFNELYQYMSSKIEMTVINNIEKQFCKTETPELELNNRYIGLINKQLGINEINSDVVIECLNKTYDFNLPKIKYNENEFKIGNILYKNNKHFLQMNDDSKVKLSIKHIRTKFFTSGNKNTTHDNHI